MKHLGIINPNDIVSGNISISAGDSFITQSQDQKGFAAYVFLARGAGMGKGLGTISDCWAAA